MDAQAISAALARDALEIHYQPIVVLPSRQVIGFEALARIRDIDGTLIPPNDFIPAAEESGLIVALGHEVLRQAVAQAARWRSGSSALTTATVSVNVAPAQLEQPGIIDEVITVLAENDVPGSALILEITESAATSPGIRVVIEQLSALGIRGAIDDFGTGFATLDTLRRFPVHMLKLDRTFVTGVTREGTDRAIVRVVIQLAESLGLSVVAEGIETEEQAAAVLGLGCAVMQGYLFARGAADPLAVAAAVVAGDSETSTPEREGPQRWPVAVDEAVIAAARLLGVMDSDRRGAVHAVATALARAAALDDHTVRTVGRLALVHDVGRLMVDGALPLALGADDRLRSLSASAGFSGELTPDPARTEIGLVRAAVSAVNRVAVAGSELDARSLSEALEAEALEAEALEIEALEADSLEIEALDVELRVAPARPADLLRRVAQSPPEIVPFGELMDDLDRRRMGRRGMEERMRSVFGITKVLSSSRDTRELMRVALEEVRRIVGAASASVERWERESNQLRCLVNVGTLAPTETTFPEDEVYPLANFAQARRTMLTGLPYIHRVDDPTVDVDAITLLKELGKYSSAAVPIYVDGRIWGQLWFATDYGEPHFEARDIETLMAVATLMGGVVVQAESLQRVDRMAFEDALTQVGNRRVVDDVLERLSAAGEQTALALLDLDRLKEINDRDGHARGDAAIREVAETLTEAVASWSHATVGRLGGDEFCVVLPNCSLEGARRLMGEGLTRLRERGGPSVSVGLAMVETGLWAARDLLAAADEELYRAKRAAHAGQDQTERRRDPRIARPRRHSSTPTVL